MLLLLLVLGVSYADTVMAMIHEWRTDTYAVHGMFVPLFAAHFLWTDRERLRAALGGHDVRGLVVFVLSLAALGGGYAVDSLLLRGWSLVAAIAGATLWAFGPRVLRVAAFPLGFLLLMVPLPRAAVAALTIHLQLFAANFAGDVLAAVGTPVYQQGVYIYLPSITLEIAELCNGLRFLLALLVLTIAFAEITQPTFWRKCALVLSVIPVAVLANATRVTVIGLAAHYWGPEAASGPIHHAIGKVVWALTLIPMFGIGYFLWRTGSKVERPSRDMESPAQDAQTYSST